VADNTQPSTIVIGAGISGLTCAYRLRRRGISVLVLEAAPRAGGMIRSVQEDGYLFELGPQSSLVEAPLLALITELGLAERLERANPRAPRYVLHRGRLRAVAMGPGAFVASSLLSARTKLRLIGDAFGRTQPPDEDESVAAFVRRKFTAELLDRLVAPMVSGIYAGDAERLSLASAFPSIRRFEREHGSVIRGAMKSRPAKGAPKPTLCSFPDGLEELPRALAQSLGDALWCDTHVVAIRAKQSENDVRAATTDASTRADAARFQIDIVRGGTAQTLSADCVVVATPCDVSAAILAGIDAAFAPAFRQIEYAPVAVVSTGYVRKSVGNLLDGFGFLVPRSEGLRLLGTVWTSSLFPERAPVGHVNLTSFTGGATDPEICALPESEIAAQITNELAKILRISAPPAALRVQKYARALPQYNLGHARILESLAQLTARAPGLFLAGNYLTGSAVGACVEQATQTSEAVAAFRQR
jgi:oxygen-dependent protoporphyrinogen oxidase